MFTLFERFVPLKRVRHMTGVPLWFNHDIRRVFYDRDFSHCLWKRSRSISDRNNYRRLRNRVTAMTRRAKNLFWSIKLNSNRSPRDLWRSLNKLGIGKRTGNVNSIVAPDILNKHFLLNQTSNNLPFLVDHCLQDPDKRLYLHNVSIDDVRCAILKLKSDAVGLDSVPLRLFKLSLPVVLPFITHIFNFCITTSTFPSLLKRAKIVPVPKDYSSGDASASDFRPISILPSLSKVFERLLNDQILRFVSSNRLLNKFQSGFRSGYSTTHLIP